MIFSLTWRNLWRNPRRSLITMSSIAFAVMLAIVTRSLQKGVFDNLVRNVVSFYAGYIQLHQRGYWEERVIEASFVSDPVLMEKLQGIDGVQAIVPRLESFALVSVGNTTKGCMVVGTDPGLEDRVTGLKQKLVSGTFLNGRQGGVLVAEGLAGKMKVRLGDTVVLLGQGYQGSMAAGKYPVRGLLRFGAPQLNNTMVFMDLADAQQFTAAEGLVTSLAFAIRSPQEMEAIQHAIQDRCGPSYEVLNWKQMMPDIENHMRADAASLYIQSGVLYLIIAFGLFSTLLMMMAERKYEFGMLVAIGMRKAKLSRMLMMENGMLTLLGSAAGMALSLPIVVYLSKRPIRFSGQTAKAYEQFGFEAIFPAAVDGRIFFTQAFTVIIIALVVGIYPLWHVARIDPVKSMKK